MKVVVVTNLFPNPLEPTRAIFMTHFVRALRKEVEIPAIIVPLPWCPKWALLKRFPRFYLSASIPDRWEWEGMPVFCPKYFYLPKIMGALQALMVFFAIFPLLRRFKAEDRCQLINAHFIYPDGVAASLAARLLHLPIVLSARGTDINLYAHYRLRRPQIAAALSGANQITAVSKGLIEEMTCLGISPQKISLMENGIDRDAFAPRDPIPCRHELGLDPKRDYLLFVGRLSKEKNVNILIEAVRILQGENRHFDRHFDLHLAGDGPMQNQWEAQARLLKFPDRIHFHGAVNHADIPIWMGGCSVLCLPSLREGTPNVILEAFASGRPVVASHVGGCIDLIDEDKNGYLCSPDNPQQWANALRAALSKKWNVDAIVGYVAHRTWHKTAEGYRDLFRKALGSV